MVNTTLNMIKNIDIDRFSSNMTKEYYEVIRELLSIILLLDGYKIYGEGAHKRLIDYIKSNYATLSEKEILLMDELRRIHNRISYDGFFVDSDFLKRKLPDIENLIIQLKDMVKDRI